MRPHGPRGVLRNAHGDDGIPFRFVDGNYLRPPIRVRVVLAPWHGVGPFRRLFQTRPSRDELAQPNEDLIFGCPSINVFAESIDGMELDVGGAKPLRGSCY